MCADCDTPAGAWNRVSTALLPMSPTARRLMREAAVTYDCISAGDSTSALAMLSKPAGGIVRRQQTFAVHRQRQQIAHRVGVFVAIHPVQHHGAGIRMPRRGFVERCFETR